MYVFVSWFEFVCVCVGVEGFFVSCTCMYVSGRGVDGGLRLRGSSFYLHQCIECMLACVHMAVVAVCLYACVERVGVSSIHPTLHLRMYGYVMCVCMSAPSYVWALLRSYNDIFAPGATALARGLRHVPRLRHLHLGYASPERD